MSVQQTILDILSQGCSADERLQSALWERGPPWLTDHSRWPRWSPNSLAADDVVLATAVDSHVQGVQSHSGSLQDLIGPLQLSRHVTYFS